MLAEHFIFEHGTIAATERCVARISQSARWHKERKGFHVFLEPSKGQQASGLTRWIAQRPAEGSSAEEVMMTHRAVLSIRAQRERRNEGPRLGLNGRQNKAIRFLGRYHPEPQPTSVIPGVSDITMEELIARNVVAEVQAREGTERVFVLIALGADEVRRLAFREKLLRDDLGNRRDGRAVPSPRRDSRLHRNNGGSCICMISY
ncbi:Hypothetical protein NGAL_HAMBI2610_23430 [Neorhizobium galegae bv. orientalis]|nr:Hypothetical protein NGAL_HAMBI2610_23430 [Neorhizobium galegae bv. orientalis]